MAVQKVATQVIEDAAVTDAKLNTTGTMPAWNGSALTNLPGEQRNFIIDGDFTQWPEGTTFTGATNNAYHHAMWITNVVGSEIVVDVTRSTDVPTVAESGYSSNYSLKLVATTAETTLGATAKCVHQYFVTGTDLKALLGQEITLAWWAKSTTTGIHCITFGNNALDRQYVHEYTIATTDTWEKFSHTFTLTNSGTWLQTEADRGAFIGFTMNAGDNFDDATNDTFATTQEWGTANQVNSMDDDNDAFLLSQVGLYLGSVAPTFTSPPIATVKDQVDYYIQKSYEDGVNPGTNTYTNLQYSQAWATNNTLGFQFPKPMRAEPSVDVYSKLGTANRLSLVTGSGFGNIGTISALDLSNKGVRYLNDSTNVLTAGNLHAFHWVADARH